MKDKTITMKKNFDEEIKFYIRKKKEENSALKKLLSALESAKRNAGVKNEIS
jgi:hypothetical protein